MTIFTRRISAAFLALALALGPAGAQSPDEGEVVARALAAADAGDWPGAASLASRAESGAVSDMVRWLRLRDGLGTWEEHASFLARNGDWPGLGAIRRHGERIMPPDLAPDQVLGFFAAEPPATGAGLLRYSDALSAAGHGDRVPEVLADNWPGLALTADEQAALLARFGAELASLHPARLDSLLWEGRTVEARRMLPLVDADRQALARARIAVRLDADGSTVAINAVPAKLGDDPGLAFERYLYRVNKGRWEDAEAWMLRHSASAATLGRPEMWMDRRANLARQALRRGEVSAAYQLAAQNFGREGAAYADAEWLAGFISLIFRGDPLRAIAHFQRFGAAVFTPISLGRAGYWLGRAYEAAGDPAAAHAAYAEGARHQTSFYGQLAAEHAGLASDAGLAGEAGRPDWRGQPFMRSALVQAGYYFHAAGDEAHASLFLRHAAAGLPPDQRAALAQMAIDIARPQIGIRIAKEAAADGVVLPNQYYPLTEIASGAWPVPTEFAHAIARQESELNPAAVSPAGARGLMQLMPGTARLVTRDLGIAYDERRLVSDPVYNATLGTAYLEQMLSRFGGSYVLASAAYNAGPGRVEAWIAAFGDPRRPAVDPIVWIEMIPFEETRNYVMRVMESLHVYRARIRGQAGPIRLVADINATG